MNSEQAAEILLTIKDVYPRFELNERKTAILVPVLKKMDFEGVMAKLKEHIGKHPFPPTIAEIAHYPSGQDRLLKKIGKFEQEAEKEPPTPEQKQEFNQKFKELMNK
ncbi:replicative helicase loader/inhibitor [Halalkalibacter sp. APA_J-10(15)]|uniref:replicative helicase loader/inhibitor n=1 Tax=Halalkalibacter sp. APA_J-10(15) TaxID=2933805 RepID=UPI001FF3DF27|nr:replicative helicase loader/inhibitor [Halalkalibacter sp. APA_J-10(15)]MCK0471420.1 replicative helicase loader/inhibitor [Halalkalibacter sp. APA_J-10(15)]